VRRHLHVRCSELPRRLSFGRRFGAVLEAFCVARAHRAPHRWLLGEEWKVLGEYPGADVVDDRCAEPSKRLDVDLCGVAEGLEVAKGARAGAPVLSPWSTSRSGES